MKHIIKFRWLIIVAWILAAAGFTIFTPNLQELVAEKGQITVPENYPSSDAEKLQDKMIDSGGSMHDLVLVFHKESGLDSNDKKAIKTVIDDLNKNKRKLEIDSILDFTEGQEIADSTVSEDETTILVPIEASTNDQTIADLRTSIDEKADLIDLPHALTGQSLIEEDIIINSEEGLTKTIYITVALILVILFLVFRSFVAPIIPLLTVGISYLIADGIVAILADSFSFPISTFTQIFMVSIMFGIGTDYCILVISRFKEEMNLRESIPAAVVETYKGVGKTVVYAALAVLIGFSTIGLSQFSLYQSAVAVAIGVFVVTLAILTVIPFFLTILGKKLFWPFDKNAEHKESGLWGTLGKFTWTRPVFSIIIILIITLPALLFYKNDQSFDNLAELNDNYDTVIAFNWIEKSFGPGEIMPITVLMEVDNKIESAEDYQAIETITAAIADMEHIDKVRSATRPTGDIIDDFLLESQTDILGDGLDEILDGVGDLQTGLQDAADEMKKQSPELVDAEDGVQQLISGTNEIKDGLNSIKGYLDEIETGLRDGSLGLAEAIDGLKAVESNFDKTIQGHSEILSGYKEVTKGLEFAEQEIQAATDLDIDFDIESMMLALDGLSQSVEGMNSVVNNVETSIQEIPEYQQAYGTAKAIIEQLQAGLLEAAKQMEELEDFDVSFQELIMPLKQLNKSYEEVIAGQKEIAAGVGSLISGLSQLEAGLKEAADGQKEITNNFSPLNKGLSEINEGQGELKSAFTELADGLDELADGLTEGSDGLLELQDGLNEVNRYLSEMDFSNQKDIVVIPEEALDEEEFLEAAEIYMSTDKTIIKFEAILDIHPYSKDALALVDEVDKTLSHVLKDTSFAGANFKIGGTSSMNNDLSSVSESDYSRTAIFMLIGIFIILAFLLRSLVMPVYILISLLLTYYTALGFTEILFVRIIGQEGLTWAVPFFSFVMLIALGVDYSIFLMGRLNEYNTTILYDAMMKSMRNMGTVIISATVILGGTFGAMLPSGVLSLLQIATVVIIGLALYALVILPLLTPIFVKLFGKYNWWPFHNKE